MRALDACVTTPRPNHHEGEKESDLLTTHDQARVAERSHRTDDATRNSTMDAYPL